MKMVSQQLVDQWRVRLAAWQQRLDEGRPRPWLARAYVRVLSFLLAQYAPTSDATEPASTPVSGTDEKFQSNPDRSAMRFEAATPELAGKPPRSRDEIRSVLEAVKAKVPHVEQGPLADGLHPDDPIVVAAFYREGLALWLEEVLETKRIEARLKRFRRQTEVIVRAGDLEGTKPIVAALAAAVKDSSRDAVQHTKLFAPLGTALGVIVGIGTAAIIGNPDIVAIFLLSIVFGVYCGAILGLVGLILGTIVDG
ncbi:MAG TPA: hypothetical protein VFI31_10880 [Pirellulales bacterium]|nr:hypothetical protein [Pirellulales bacterium]